MKDKAQKIIFSENTALYSILVGLTIFTISLVIFFIKGNWVFSTIDNINEEKIAQYGDFIGGVIGSLFSLVGIILFYVALKEQRQDFKTNQESVSLQVHAFNQQINEFKAQREELESTRKIYEQQTKTMRNQQFDSNFYSLLEVFISNKRKLDNGANYFEKMYEDVLLAEDFGNGELITDFHNKIVKKYENIFLSKRDKLSQYFKTLYRLLKMIDECEHFSESEKIFYSKILRSQITNSELLILYYNYHSIFGKKVQSLILKYDMLKHLETVSKAEFQKKFSLSTDTKVEFIIFAEHVKSLLFRNIDVAKATDGDIVNIQENYKRLNCIVAIHIDTDIELKLHFSIDTTHIIGLKIEEFKELVYLFLNNEMYYNKFINTDNNEISQETATNSTNIILKYSIKIK